MIKGVGIDFIEKRRIRNIVSRFGNKFVDRVLTESEKVDYLSRKGVDKKVSFLSNNFASKEAASKALGTGFSEGITLKTIEVLRRSNGSPYLNLVGEAKKRAKEMGYKNFKLSISDTSDLSIAFVIGEGK